MKEDILMWLSFIERFNGSCSFGKNIWLSNREIKLYTDSAGNPELGCGEYFSGSTNPAHCVIKRLLNARTDGMALAQKFNNPTSDCTL
jgi:hypothetical protein